MRLNRPDGTGSPVQAGMYLKHNLNSTSTVSSGGATRLMGPGWLATSARDGRALTAAPRFSVITNAIAQDLRISALLRRLRIRRSPQPTLLPKTGGVFTTHDAIPARRKILRRSRPSVGVFRTRNPVQKRSIQSDLNTDLNTRDMAPGRCRQAFEHLPARIRTRRVSEI